MKHSTLQISTTGFGSAAAAIVATVALLGGCAHIDGDDEEETVIVAPSSGDSAPRYGGDGSIPANRPVVRMSDGQRDWEIEIPERQRGYQVSIPLGDDRGVQPDHYAKTGADRDLIDHRRRTDPDYEREGPYDADGDHVSDELADREREDLDDPEVDDADRPEDDRRAEADPAPTRPSYTRGLDNVQRLYETGHHEQALNHLYDLAEAYPNDERIKSMKGTLWLEMGEEGLARKFWEQVLRINEDNESVRRALRRLEGAVDEPPPDEQEALQELEDDQTE